MLYLEHAGTLSICHLYKVCLVFSWRVALALLDHDMYRIILAQECVGQMFSQFTVLSWCFSVSINNLPEKYVPLIQRFWRGWWKKARILLWIWLLADCGGFGCGLGIHRTGGLDKILWFFSDFAEDKYFEFWSGVDARIGDSILLELGQGEGAWFMDLLSAYSVLDAVCSLSLGSFYFRVSVKEFEAPRSYEDP